MRGLLLILCSAAGCVCVGNAQTRPGGSVGGDATAPLITHGATAGTYPQSLKLAPGAGVTMSTNSGQLIISTSSGAPPSAEVKGSGNDSTLGTTFGTLLSLSIPAAGTYMIQFDGEFVAFDSDAAGVYQHEEAVTQFYDATGNAPLSGTVRRSSVYTTEKVLMTTATRYVAPGARTITVRGATVSVGGSPANVKFVATNSACRYFQVQ